MNAADKTRKNNKADAIAVRLSRIGDNLPTLLGLLDETKLDLLILALGIGAVELSDNP